MALDPYSPCPCGSGKKLKFCCSDLAGEFEKIDRMLESEQRQACLSHVEKLEQRHRDRPALLALKASLLREMGRLDEAEQVVRRLCEIEPNHPVALAEEALIRTTESGPVAGVEPLQRAIAACGESMPAQVVEALGVMGRALAMTGYEQAARGHLWLYLQINRGDQEALNAIVGLNTSQQIPLLLKEEFAFEECYRDTDYKAEFDGVMEKARQGKWLEAADELTQLAEREPEDPAIWHNLAVLRGWLADDEATVAAWRRYAGLNVEPDAAVEAEARAQLIDPAVNEKGIDQLILRYPINDIEQLRMRLTADRHTLRAEGYDPSAVQSGEDDQPPPRDIFYLLDKPALEEGSEATLDNIPNVLGTLMLFGRQTDREARLEMEHLRDERLATSEATLVEAAGDALGERSEEEVIGQHRVEGTVLSWQWHLPPHLSRDEAHRLSCEKYRRVVLEDWTETPLPVLDGKTPRECAGDEAMKVRVQAAVLRLEFQPETFHLEFDANELREKLGLPATEPIDPGEVDVNRLPLVRLGRLEAEKLSDEQLQLALRRAAAHRAQAAMQKLAEEMLRRPSVDEQVDKADLYGILAGLAGATARAVEYIEKARGLAQEKGDSCAAWDLEELKLRLARGEPDDVLRLIRHVQSTHMNEPNVGYILQQILMQAGVLGPEGKPRKVPEPSQMVSPESEAAEPTKLWTPDQGEAPQGEKPAIWVPGQD